MDRSEGAQRVESDAVPVASAAIRRLTTMVTIWKALCSPSGFPHRVSLTGLMVPRG